MTEIETSRGTSGDTQSVSDSEQEVSDRKPYKDVDGNVIDAPVIPDFERRLTDARDRADVNAISELQEEYHKARDKKVKDDNAREKKRRQQEDK